jgi:putative inorganic carbon (hco3(-)) transporter
MRDYLVVGLVLGTLPIGLFRPFYGLLAYAWISYMYPQEMAWTFAQNFPVAKLSALSVLVGAILNREIRTDTLFKRETVIMVLLWSMFTVSSFFAFYPALAWAKWQDVSKFIAMALLTSMLLTDHKRFKYFLLVIAISIGFYGAKGGFFSLLTGGQYTVWGPGSSIMGGNNNIGLALNMNLPLCWYLAMEQRGWRKRALQAVFFLTIPAIMFTYSRASAMTIPILLLVMGMKSKHRVVFIVGAVVLVMAIIPFIPAKFWERQGTVFTYKEDMSAMSRIDNWKFCWRLAMDYPLVGAGFDYMNRDVLAKYAPEFLNTYGGRVWNTHSIYLAMLSSHGFVGLALFLAMIGFCCLACRQMERAVRGHPDLAWVGTYSKLIQVSFLGFLINGAFVNMEYFELVYAWVAVVAALKVACYQALAQREAEAPVFSSALLAPNTL